MTKQPFITDNHIDLAVRLADQYNAPYTDYARDVVFGTIPTCELATRACLRFLEDLISGHWNFEPKRVSRLRWIEKLCLTDGKFKKGAKFKLMGWQWFVLANLFGFVDDDGLRRYREAILYTPKGNGKTAFMALIALYMMLMDEESVPHIWCGAVNLEQAKICWEMAVRIINATPGFKEQFKIAITQNNTDNKIKLPDGTFFSPTASVSKGKHGKNPHLAIIDEIASHTTPEVYGSLNTSLKRQQPLIISASTATSITAGIGKERWDYVVKMMNQEITDERTFGLIYTLDENDDPYDPAVWRKANPSWGLAGVNPIAFEKIMNQAKNSVALEEEAFTFRLNKWYSTSSALFSTGQLRTCADKTLRLEDFAGQQVEVSVDLAYVSDLLGIGLTFAKQIDGKTHYYHFAKGYLNEEAVKKGWNINYPVWTRPYKSPTNNWYDEFQYNRIVVTPGNMTDFQYMINDILDLQDKFQIRHINIDRYKAVGVIKSFQEAGLPIEIFKQDMVTMHAPTVEFETAYKTGRFHFDGDPCFEWNVGCVIPDKGSGGLYKPDKNRNNPNDKIDTFICCVMGMARWMDEEPETNISVYATKDLIKEPPAVANPPNSIIPKQAYIPSWATIDPDTPVPFDPNQPWRSDGRY